MSAITEWAYSADGSTAEPRGRLLPRTMTLEDGRIVSGLSPERAPEFGWYPLRREAPEPYGDGLSTIATVVGHEAVLKAVVPSDSERRDRALAALEWRITTHRDRLVAIATTGMPHDSDGIGVDQAAVQKTQLQALMQANMLNFKLSEGTATPADLAAIQMMAMIPAEVRAIELARLTLSAWTAEHLTDWQSVHEFDPSQPPQEAPQWPVV